MLAWVLCGVLLSGCNGVRSHPRPPLPDDEAGRQAVAEAGDPGPAAPAVQPGRRGLDTGPVATAMRAWIDAGPASADRRARRAAIVQAARRAGYQGPADAHTFIGDMAPGLGPMKAGVARTLQIIP